jgi:hypothetical protein
MLTRPGKDVVQLVSNNSGESTADHGGIIPIPEHSHEMRAVYIEIRKDPIRHDRGIGKNHARPQARCSAQIGFASCAGSFNGSNSNEIEVFAAFAVCEVFPDDTNTCGIEQPFQLGPHHLAGFRAHAIRMLEVQSQGSCLSVSADTKRTHEQHGENRPHDETPLPSLNRRELGNSGWRDSVLAISSVNTAGCKFGYQTLIRCIEQQQQFVDCRKRMSHNAAHSWFGQAQDRVLCLERRSNLKDR